MSWTTPENSGQFFVVLVSVLPMAFLWRHPKSQYWIARFYDGNGKRRNRSTRCTERKKAQKLADAFEEAANRKRTAAQTRRVIAALHAEITGQGLPVQTLRQFIRQWNENKRAETVPSTVAHYENVAAKFLDFLGDRADADIAEVTMPDILAFRAHESHTFAPKTVNHSIKYLRMVFKVAKRDGLIADNPAEFVKTVREREADKRARRPFTVDELRAVLSVADAEWRSMILLGLYTGQRLADTARLTWANLDLQAGEIRLITGKTGKRILIPLAGPLKVHVESLSAPDEPEAPVHPRAHATLLRQGKAGGLSNQFAGLLTQAGLRRKQPHRKTHGAGRGVGSSSGGLSFHCLRHTAVSLLKEAGVPAAVVMELVGHDSPEISTHYTHIGRESLADAAAKFPDLLVK
jgi:integrase